MRFCAVPFSKSVQGLLSDTMLYYVNLEVMTMEVRVTVTCNKGNGVTHKPVINGIDFDANILVI